ncbi:hypothetical protein ERO13_A08G022700v2 [Gossypium hirsutum]|uniref:Uncharacterized protein n=4 Tax=Gossypium TaxID=3633 RepID=A0A5J5UL88_GOSBA|nr:hypothetical protein ES319_A08G027900v1 [Gossypium barbadense]KAG4186122.1 hypothetical protein ERO13_A08G022700v2 [Gossypium hirsutum]TYH04743.1 hypothetical protein ES288_A08G030700v1 [Gossypium darwinii]TYI13024.1 hypothetical protein ES332_A08G030000v1 [Gossypium tomentosum]TYJ20924.1 hypothetical protein E1A91_A08G030200v1 [Gossypium mustelinum]
MMNLNCKFPELTTLYHKMMLTVCPDMTSSSFSDAGGETSIRPYWRCYFPNTQALESLLLNDHAVAMNQ